MKRASIVAKGLEGPEPLQWLEDALLEGTAQLGPIWPHPLDYIILNGEKDV